MSEVSPYPNVYEIRQWAMQKNPNGIQYRGALPKAVLVAWDRAHPDRPYVKAQAHHGTASGYTKRDCRCRPCMDAWAALKRATYRGVDDIDHLSVRGG